MTRQHHVLLLVAAFFLAYLLPLGFHGLWIPDETRYAQISQEMLHSGNWAAPHFMGLRYFEKPAAGYWLIAAAQAVFGENLFGVRFASALTTGLSVMLTWLIARRMWADPRKSFACALLYMSFFLVAGQSGYANLDPQFTLWLNLTLVAFWFAVHSGGRQRLLCWALLGLACAMGFMTKGFLAWALPVLVALPYMIWRRRLRELLTFGPLAILVAVLVCLPWVVAVHGRESDYWRFFFWHEHIRRFAGSDAQHSEPWWYYLPLLVVACVPWALLLPATLKQAWTERRLSHTGFLLMWLILPLAFLSLSKGKLPTYLLPCLMPLALLMGHALVDRLSAGKTTLLRVNGLLNAGLGLAALAALLFMQVKKSVYHQEPQHLTLAVIVLLGWVAFNALQGLKPLRFWLMPALGSWLAIALVPAALPNSIVFDKTPDQFVLRHLGELGAATHLLSNDLGAAAALSWRLKRNDVVFYDTRGELEYGLGYPQTIPREVDWHQVQAWMTQARREGAVAVVMRGNVVDDAYEFSLLPQDARRYEEGNLTILIFDRTPS
ncbi:lipid IV(A) 4-amino-4-deoxy-L-arabinosyltransferase [Pseudomonas sp. NPDC087358]|uniref:lipid IV(A) 4-amino-4-deoxy-L-arabinosyltransferase n=1 Tax=Pseudomonas sp. NPDC087358 TaxID=3364439 RepID=UPI00384A5B92